MSKRIAIVVIVGILLIMGGLVFMYRDQMSQGPSLPSGAGTTPPTTTPTSTGGGMYTPPGESRVRISYPTPNTTVSSPFVVRGEARGNWFFEASFPVRLLDSSGREIANGIAQAEGEWMTEDFVPFTAPLAFSVSTTSSGTLILEKDNPSGLPEHAAEVRIPVQLRAVGAILTPPVTVTRTPPITGSGCRPTGCSGQICSDKNEITDCMYRPEYGCYKTAICERRANGACGWRDTAELRACLREDPALKVQISY